MRRLALLPALLAVFLACDDETVTRPERADLQAIVEELAEPADLEGLTDRQLLVALISKVDALEARLDREAGLAHAMVDSVMNAPQWGVLMSLAAAPNPIPPDEPGNPGGGGGMAADISTILERTDSIMDQLYDAGAEQQICFDLAVPLVLAATDELAGGAEINGGVGVKVFGNGAEGAIKIERALKLSAALSVEPAFNYTICYDPASGRGGPAATSAFRASAAGAPLAGDLQSAFDAMGLDASVVSSTLNFGSSLLSGQLDFSDLSDAPRTIWLPPAVQNLVNNPGTFTAGLREAGEDALSGLCDTSIYPPDIRDAVAEACAVQLPGLQTIVTPVDLTPLESTVTAVCGGLNDVLDTSLSIPQFNVPKASTSILGVSYETFPGATLGGQSISLFGGAQIDCSFAATARRTRAGPTSEV